jgi:transposase
VSSGEKKVYRLSGPGNRRLNQAIHMAAVTQIRFAGRIYYERKRAEGKSGKEAIRALKRRISDLIYARLVADAQATGTLKRGPGGQAGNDSNSSATGSHPRETGSSEKPLPDPPQHYDPAAPPEPEGASPEPLDTKRYSIGLPSWPSGAVF